MRNFNSIRRAARPSNARPSEDGYLLLAVMFLLALLVLSLAVAAPQVAKDIQRDRDLETIERGKQYIRAIQLYYRRFHAYPPSVDALVKTNEIRFLRKRYLDPITGKDDWKPIMFGQNKVPTAMGFFGQPLSTGSSIAGIGPSGGNGLQGASPIGGTNSGLGSGSSFGGSTSGGDIFGSSDASSGSAPGGSTSGSSGGNASTPAGSGTASTTGGSTDGTDSGTAGSTSGQTFGGAGIIGFSPGSSKQSILVYKKKDHYNEWEFTYDPLMDTMTMSGGNAGAIGQPASGISNPVGSSPFSSPSSGSTGGFDSTSSTPTQPQP